MELAIPLIAFGGLYLISNRKKEAFTVLQTDLNYPKDAPVTSENNLNYYAMPNQATDKYFGQLGGTTTLEEQTMVDMANRTVNIQDFVVNNMVPVFGKQKDIGNEYKFRSPTDSTLDNMVGSGSLQISKSETAPLFRPEDNIQYANGAPNQSDFYQSRVNPSLKMSNVKPFQEQYVAPGLNQGYTSNGSGGFNSGMEARNLWVDKPVNELRVETNPKTTYGLVGHEGPAESLVQNLGIEGKVEKYRPDAFFINTPDRYLTTTGIEKGETLRAIQPDPTIHRATTSKGYSGVAGKGTVAEKQMQRGVYREDHRIQLGAEHVTPALGIVEQNNLNVVQSNYKLLNNNRSQCETTSFGNAGGLVNAIAAPILDMLRPSRKENVIGTGRLSGNPGGEIPRAPVVNKSQLGATIRDTTCFSPFALGQRPYDPSEGAYKVTEYQPVSNHRDTTNVNYTGNSSCVNPYTTSYDSAYNCTISSNRVHDGVTNHGRSETFNPNINQQNNNLKTHVQYNGNPNGVISTPSTTIIGSVNMPQTYQPMDRMNPDLLQAFKNNPFTHSLNSVA